MLLETDRNKKYGENGGGYNVVVEALIKEGDRMILERIEIAIGLNLSSANQIVRAIGNNWKDVPFLFSTNILPRPVFGYLDW